ncbi:MAG TPA: FUSC family protein [Ilumatobacteraceae bacterium]|nr:FUSC family protein [Ilumatobacteraceae bacterium]
MIVVAGVALGTGLLLGSVLTQLPALAVVALFAVAVAATQAARRMRIGGLLVFLVVPMVGAGLGIDDVSEAMEAWLLISGGAVITWVVALAWPQESEQPRGGPLAGRDLTEYGVRLGLAGALCAAISYVAGFDHEGWAAAACLLVMRPNQDLLRLRSAGRAIAVSAGAAAAAVVFELDVPTGVMAALLVLDLALLAGTRASRWYVTGGFTTFIVLSLMLHSDPDHSGRTIAERLVETLLGVGVALVFGAFTLRRPSPRLLQERSKT